MIRLGSQIAGILLASVVLATVHAAARGLSWTTDAAALEKKLERGDAVQQRHAELRATVGVTLEEFVSLIDAGAVVIDARPREEFEKAHLSIESYPPVLNVEPERIDQHLERLFSLQGQTIVLYCTSLTCELAEELYIAMESYGFSGMKIYFDGWEGIVEAQLPTASGPDVWTGYESELGGQALGEDAALAPDGVDGQVDAEETESPSTAEDDG